MKKLMEGLDPEAAKIFREKGTKREILIRVDEENEENMFKVVTESHPDVVFIDIAVALGVYIGKNAKSLEMLKRMTDTIRQAVTAPSVQEYVKRDPKRAAIEALMETLPDRLKELTTGNADNKTKTECAECSKPCPLAGKRTDPVAETPDGVVCVHLHGPEGLN